MNVMVVTGASSGIGEGLARHFTGEGWTVCGLARNRDKLQALTGELGELFEACPTDISDSAHVRRTMVAIAGKHGHVDVLINNAAAFATQPFAEQDYETIDRLIDTNLKGAMYCTRALAPAMIERGRGRIINIASVSGTHGIEGQAIYGASKHGMLGFNDVIAQELKAHGVLVTSICPGGVATPLWDAETNPYFGESDNMTHVEEIVDLIEFILRQPTRTLHKRFVFFPTGEWH
jgi:3-hydroxy acid dehydrogenase / malonic semialdehyde reductase